MMAEFGGCMVGGLHWGLIYGDGESSRRLVGWLLGRSDGRPGGRIEVLTRRSGALRRFRRQGSTAQGVALELSRADSSEL